MRTRKIAVHLFLALIVVFTILYSLKFVQTNKRINTIHARMDTASESKDIQIGVTPEEVLWLKTVAGCRSGRLQKNAFRLLARIADKTRMHVDFHYPGDYSNSLIHQYGGFDETAINICNILSEEVVPIALQARKKESTDIKTYAKDILTALGSKALPSLLKALDSEDIYVQISATETMWQSGDFYAAFAHPALWRWIERNPKSIFSHFVDVLSSVNESSILLLIEALESENTILQECARTVAQSSLIYKKLRSNSVDIGYFPHLDKLGIDQSKEKLPASIVHKLAKKNKRLIVKTLTVELWEANRLMAMNHTDESLVLLNKAVNRIEYKDPNSYGVAMTVHGILMDTYIFGLSSEVLLSDIETSRYLVRSIAQRALKGDVDVVKFNDLLHKIYAFLAKTEIELQNKKA